MTDSLPYPGTLEANVLRFAATLRAAGFLAGPGEVRLALAALAALDLADRQELRLAWRSLFATSPLERQRFDRLFAHYWGGNLLEDEPERIPNPLPQPPKPQRGVSLEGWDARAAADELWETAGYSALEVALKGAGASRADEVAALARLLRQLARGLATQPSRRFEATPRRGELADLRRTLRRSVMRGGEPLHLVYRRRRLSRMNVVFAFDVSGSMLAFSAFLLQLALALVRARQLGRAEVFGFATDLYRLTGALQRGGVQEALAAAQRAMPGRTGGTKIGASLAKLAGEHGGLIDRRTTLLIHSDGWDTGDLDVLRRAMKTLHERAGRVIWLNPLAGSPGYRPTASGMKTALPYIDVFAPVHNLESLRAFVRRLERSRP
jgi:uncharacterized protein